MRQIDLSLQDCRRERATRADSREGLHKASVIADPYARSALHVSHKSLIAK